MVQRSASMWLMVITRFITHLHCLGVPTSTRAHVRTYHVDPHLQEMEMMSSEVEI